jgi:hypothetical protein
VSGRHNPNPQAGASANSADSLTPDTGTTTLAERSISSLSRPDEVARMEDIKTASSHPDSVRNNKRSREKRATKTVSLETFIMEMAQRQRSASTTKASNKARVPKAKRRR